MNEFDMNSSVVEYASEEITIPYLSPVDNKIHRYFPDFYVKTKDKDGVEKQVLIEVKPAIQTVPPRQPKKTTARFISEVKTYAVNDAKWKAAKRFCDEVGWEFKIVTEKELGIK